MMRLIWTLFLILLITSVLYSQDGAPDYCFLKKDKINTDASIIGISVISGVTATFKPSLTLCLIVCVTTKVISGPGAKPADKPSTIPAANGENNSMLLKIVFNCVISFFNLLVIKK